MCHRKFVEDAKESRFLQAVGHWGTSSPSLTSTWHCWCILFFPKLAPCSPRSLTHWGSSLRSKQVVGISDHKGCVPSAG